MAGKLESITITINGEPRTFSVDRSEMLLETLRRASYFGVKNGCKSGDCGACTVLLDGQAVRSCLVLAIEVDGQSVTTLEGVGRDGPTALQKAFIRDNSFQCGFCAPGVVLSAAALLAEKPDPTEREVREALAGNLCRCTGYAAIVDTVLSVAKRNRRKSAASRRRQP